MFYQGPPGLTVDLAKPSPNGVDLLYSDDYVAAEMARRNPNPYTYANNNPLKYIDPSGLIGASAHGRPNLAAPPRKPQVCGFYAWLYCGEGLIPNLAYCCDEDVYYAALERAGTVVKCWWECEVTIHKCAGGKLLAFTEGFTGTIGAAGGRIPKDPQLFWRGFGRISPRSGFLGSTPYTSLSRVLGRLVGEEAAGKAIGRATITAGAKGGFVATMLVEAGISAVCGWRCR